MKKHLAVAVLMIVALVVHAWATDLNSLISAQAVTVNTTPAVTVKCGLNNATTVQMYIRGSSTAQIFTLTLPNGTAIEVPSGATLTLKFAKNLVSTDTLGTVITGTGSAVLQVISIREVGQ